MRPILVVSGIVAAYAVVQVAGLRSIGLTDDDDFYIPAGESYAAWLGRAITFDARAFTRAEIDRAFSPNHEHPPVAKYVFGIAEAIFAPALGPYDGARMGTVLFSTLIAALMMLLSVGHFGRRRGPWIGGLAVLFLLAMPRFYFHSHAATLDVPVAAMYLLTATLALRGERSARAAILSGVAFGLASATKLNAPFLVLPYLVFALLTRRAERRASHLALPPVPLAFLSMIAIGPIVFLLAWPWLWFDTAARIGEYVGFHLNHYGIYFLYFGEIYSKSPFAPWHAPFVMAFSTVPVATSVLAIAGMFFGWPLIRARLRFVEGPDDDLRRQGDLLLSIGLHALFTILIVALSGGAKYGGEKLFMPFFPFWALLAGYGAVAMFEHASVRWPRWVPASAVALAFASSIGLQLRFGAYALSEYNGLVGGLRGATALGFERQYYDVAFRDLVAWLGDNGPPNLRVHFLPNNWEYVRTFRWYRKDGRARSDIHVVDGEASAHWVVLTHERRFSRYGHDLERHRRGKVLYERTIDGVPIWTVIDARSR